MAKTECCPRCGEESKLAQREFSDQATSALIVWGEMDRSLPGKPICDLCYQELREVLIDRADEIAGASKEKVTDRTATAKSKKTKKAS